MNEQEATTEAHDTLPHMPAAFRTSRCGSCEIKITPMTEVHVDMLAGQAPDVVLLCVGCGVNLRYHRKRALLRGEQMPITFDDVDERLATR